MFSARRSTRSADWVLLLAAALALPACEGPQPAARDPQAAIRAQLRTFYPELAGDQFEILADFEKPEDAARLSWSAESAGNAPPEITGGGRTGPDAHALRVTFAAAADAIEFAPELTRADWSEFDWLLLSAASDSPNYLTLTLRSAGGRSFVQRMPVSPQWQTYHIDISEAAEAIDPTRIAGLTITPALPGTVRLDDLLLAKNSRYTLADAGAQPGTLYVRDSGRRVEVGAAGRFELAFADGVIVAVRGEDTRNLTLRTGLGPWPLPLETNWTDPQLAIAYDDPAVERRWGPLVRSRQQVVEASAFRVVVHGEWRFFPPPEEAEAPTDANEAAAPADGPSHRWTYVIYPAGAVYVLVESDSWQAGWGAERAGYAVALNGLREFERAAAPPGSTAQPRSAFVLMSRRGQNRADVLWTTQDPMLLSDRREMISADRAQLAVIIGAIPGASALRTAHYFQFWPRELDSYAAGESIAAAYQQPMRLRCAPGRVFTVAPGDLNEDGFNESEGCYELAPEAGLLRFFLPADHPTAGDLIFRVQETGGKRCWVYADGRVIRSVARDADGLLLFSLPPETPAATIEVHAETQRPLGGARPELQPG